MTRPTKGHHYSALLTCRRRAWLEYHGDRKEQVQVPAWLHTLRKRGLEWESQVEGEQLPGSVRLPSTRDFRAGAAETRAAILAGHDRILQAVLFDGDRIGVADVLERTDSAPSYRLGHVYRVGEIKLTEVPGLAHAMQLMFYGNILAGVQGQVPLAGFVIAGDAIRHEIPFEPLRHTFDRLTSDLQRLRQESEAPPPHLAVACASCPWRRKCVDEMVAAKHPSLLSDLTPFRVQLLSSKGVSTWADVAERQSPPAGVGLTAAEWQRLHVDAKNLHSGVVVYRRLRPPPRLADGVCVTFELDKRSDEDTEFVPTAIVWSRRGGPVERIPLNQLQDVARRALPEWRSLMQEPAWIFYGSQSRALFEEMLGAEVDEGVDPADQRKATRALRGRVIDLSAVLREKVHAALWTYGLDAVAAHSRGEPWTPRNSEDVESRLEDMETVRQWLLRDGTHD